MTITTLKRAQLSRQPRSGSNEPQTACAALLSLTACIRFLPRSSELPLRKEAHMIALPRIQRSDNHRQYVSRQLQYYADRLAMKFIDSFGLLSEDGKRQVNQDGR